MVLLCTILFGNPQILLFICCSDGVLHNRIRQGNIESRTTDEEQDLCMAALAFISQIPDVDSSQAIVTVVDMMKSEKNPG